MIRCGSRRLCSGRLTEGGGAPPGPLGLRWHNALSLNARQQRGSWFVSGILVHKSAAERAAKEGLPESLCSLEIPIDYAINCRKTGKKLITARDSLLLNLQRRNRELDRLQPLRRQVGNVCGNPHLAHKAPGVEVPTKHHKGPLRENVRIRLKAEEAVRKGHVFRMPSIQRRPPDEMRALPLVQEHISSVKLVPLKQAGEIHLHYVRSVDTVLKDVGDAQIRAHLRPIVPIRMSSPPQLHGAGLSDGGTAPVSGRFLRDKVEEDRLAESLEPATRALQGRNRRVQVRDEDFEGFGDTLLFFQWRHRKFNSLKF